jgi:SWI/SNF-related matrix-associated actin-dependent regulator of chromatin subfamily A member 5
MLLLFAFVLRSLGKTLQSISLLAYLRQFQKLNGPHLVLVPLSTLGNWHREFGRWCPSIRCFRFHGTKEERAEMVAQGQLHPDNYDVLLTSYEMSIREKSHINKVKWNFIVSSHAHRSHPSGATSPAAALLSAVCCLLSAHH